MDTHLTFPFPGGYGSFLFIIYLISSRILLQAIYHTLIFSFFYNIYGIINIALADFCMQEKNALIPAFFPSDSIGGRGSEGKEEKKEE